MNDLFFYIVCFYSFLGVLISGGLFFSKQGIANVFLAVFVLLFSIDQFYFLYESSGLIWSFPNFYLLTFPLSLLFGPMLWFHIKYLNEGSKKIKLQALIHAVPFLVLLIFTAYLFGYPGLDRVKLFAGGNNYYLMIKPINYIKVFHLCFYGILLIVYITKQKINWTKKKKNYSFVLVGIYFITAILQAFFIAITLLSKYFIIYYLVASTMVLFVAYILSFNSGILDKITIKYSKSSLTRKDKQRIVFKIEGFLSQNENIIKNEFNLGFLAQSINEQKHHISQILSEEFKSSFNDIINERRVNYSKTLLVDPAYNNLKILAIAMESGFTNKTTFTRAFLKFNRLTPSQYRKQNATNENLFG